MVLAAAAGASSPGLDAPRTPRPKAPTDMASTDAHGDATSTAPIGPVLFAYDGSELAKLAIEQAGRQLAPGRDALVVCVWQPADVGFVPAGERHFDAAEATEVRKAAEETAAHGASLAEKAGFRPAEHRGRGSADLEGDRRGRRGARREPDRARLPPPQRARGTPARQRRRRRRDPLEHRRAGRARALLRSARRASTAHPAGCG